MTDTSDPIELFESRVEARVEKGMTRADAIRDCVSKFPNLHQSYLREYNARIAEMRDRRRSGGR